MYNWVPAGYSSPEPTCFKCVWFLCVGDTQWRSENGFLASVLSFQHMGLSSGSLTFTCLSVPSLISSPLPAQGEREFFRLLAFQQLLFAVINTMMKTTWGGKGLFQLPALRPCSVAHETQGRNLENHGRTLLRLTCSTVQPRVTCPG